MELKIAQELYSVDQDPLFLVLIDIRKHATTCTVVGYYTPWRDRNYGDYWHNFGRVRR